MFACNGETGIHLSWGPLLVEISDADAPGRVTLQGWSLRKGRTSHAFELPHGTAIGMPVREVARRVPGSASYAGSNEGPFTGWFVRTPTAPYVFWHSHSGVETGRIDEVSMGITGCD